MSDVLMRLRQAALADGTLRAAQLETPSAPDPLERFCAIANEYGFTITPAQIIADGEEFSCNQTKSTNGGNPMPYDCFDDAYDMFIASIQF